MIRKPSRIAFAVLIAIAWMIADSENSDAQLLQRLRSRIQSRAIAPLPNASQYRQSGEPGQQPLRQPVVPNFNPAQQPNPNRLDAAGNPRRVAPVDPKQAADLQAGAGASRDDFRIAPNVVPVQPRNGLPNQTVARPPIDEPTDLNAGSGSSILMRQENEKPRLGIQVVESRQGIQGLLVTGIDPDSVAEKAGLVVGDLLVELQDQPTLTPAQVTQILESHQGAQEVRLRIVRNSRLSLISIPIGKAERSEVAATAAQDALSEKFGLQFRNVAGHRGAIVTAIRPDSPASASGLKIDDRIVSVDGRLLVDAESLQYNLEQTGVGPSLGLMAVRNGKLVSAKMDASYAAKAVPKTEIADRAKENSTLKGLGAAIGGLLGGGRVKTSSVEQDEMALGDDDGVQPVDFQSDDLKTDIEGAASPDPLSLEAVQISDSEETTELLPPKKSTE